MKKIFTILAICFVCVAVNAQKPIVSENTRKQNPVSFTEVKAENNISAPKATTLQPAAFTMACGLIPDQLKAYVDNNSQWMTGSNGYGDTKYGYVFKGTSGSVTSVTAYLLNGYQGDASDIYAELYTVGADGLPATLLGTSQAISTTDVPASKSAISFTFATPVVVPLNFVAVITVPTYGETSTDIVVLTSPQDCYAAGTESNPVSYGTGGWETMIAAWQTTGLFDLAIFPVLDNASGIKTNTQVAFSIFPNPAKESFNIAASSEINTVEVYNQVGQVVYSENVAANNCTINTADFATGMYLVKVISNEGTSVKKLSVTK